MKLVARGGVNERGNHCLELYGRYSSILLDCGLGGPKNPYPRLTESIAQRASYLFVSHSHVDHVGSIPHLLDLGFKGTMIMTEETYAACGHPKEWNVQFIKPEETLNLNDFLKVTAHYSGHCIGSVWFDIYFEDKHIVYSGDYIEGGSYKYTPIKDITADFGIFDGSYYKKRIPQLNESLTKIKQIIRRAQGQVLLPAPANGRGLSLLSLVQSLGYKTKVIGNIFLMDADDWLTNPEPLAPDSLEAKAILFSDKDFTRPETLQLVKDEDHKLLLFTGNLDEGSVAENLYKTRSPVAQCFYNIHETQEEMERTIASNKFTHTLVFSSNKTDEPLEIDF